MEPVWVWKAAANRRHLNNVAEAAFFILYDWPERDRGSAPYQAAKLSALEALDGRETAEGFRTAFVKAAKRAKILARKPKGYTAPMLSDVARPWARRPKR
jgi:hypothetical protein